MSNFVTSAIGQQLGLLECTWKYIHTQQQQVVMINLLLDAGVQAMLNIIYRHFLVKIKQ
jgi:hypothetical protein